MTELEIIKRRIKKLLALSKSPNENEAVSALEKATSLIEEYGLNQAEFSGYTRRSVKSTVRSVEWRTILANAVERLYATYHYHDVPSGSFVFCGEELDVFMSSEMFAYLVKTVDRMTKQNVRKNAKHRYRQSYRSGIASRLWDRMDELGQSISWRNWEAFSEKKAEIRQWANSLIPITSGAKNQKTTKANMKAFVRGEIDAEGISLSRQMNASHGRLIEAV